MSAEKRRAVLEGLAYGEGATPAERLRALELLRELDGPPEEERGFREDLAKLSGEELEAELRAFGAPLEEELDELYRDTFERELARRTRELETNFERRVRERARELAASMYVESGVHAAETAANAGEHGDQSRPPGERLEPPSGRDEPSRELRDLYPGLEALRRWDDEPPPSSLRR